MSRAGFTIIELFFAITLGMVIIGTGFYAFRTAQEMFAIGNRLADENAILLAGYFEVMEEGDFWTHTRDHLNTGPASHKKTSLQRAFATIPESDLNILDNRPIEDWYHWFERRGLSNVNYFRTGPLDHLNWHGRTFVLDGVDAATAQTIYEEARGFYGDSQFRERIIPQLGWYTYFWMLPRHAAHSDHVSGAWPSGAANANSFNRGPGDIMSATRWHNDGIDGGYAYLYNDNLSRNPVHILIQNNEWPNYIVEDELLVRPGVEMPSHWPNLSLSANRYMITGRTSNELAVTALSPYSGDLLMLQFNHWGTCIRGARIIHGSEALIEWNY